MKKVPHPDDSLSEAERKRRWLLRRASSAVGSKINIAGSVKTRGMRAAEVTLPGPETLRKILEKDE